MDSAPIVADAAVVCAVAVGIAVFVVRSQFIATFDFIDCAVRKTVPQRSALLHKQSVDTSNAAEKKEKSPRNTAPFQ